MKKKMTSLILILTMALTMSLGTSGFAAAASQNEIKEVFES